MPGGEKSIVRPTYHLFLCRYPSRLHTRRVWACLLAIFLLLLHPAFQAKADTLRTGGTGSSLGFLERIARAFEHRYPEHRVTVVQPSVGSRGGIKGVAVHALDFAVSARPLSEAEKAWGLREQEIGHSPFVIAVSQSSQETWNLTLNQLTAIYAGDMTVWWNGDRIRPILRPSGDQDCLLLQSMSEDMDEALRKARKRPGMALGESDRDTADLIQRIPGGIGPTTLTLVMTESRPLRALSINGVSPTLAALEDGTYPFTKTFHLIVPISPSEAVQQFVTFLFSDEGRTMLMDTGIRPVPD